MTKIICIFHSIDQDGYTSAAIVKSRYPDAKLIGFNYGQSIPVISANHIVVICDISFPMDIMQQIADTSERLIWIDHHKSAIDNYNNWLNNPEYNGYNWFTHLTKTGELRAACELTWEYFYGKQYIPPAILLLGMYDSFRHKGTPDENRVHYFQNTANERVDSPEKAMVYLTMQPEEVEQWIKNGEQIQQVKNVEAKEKYKLGKAVIVDGHKFIMFNTDRFNPINYGINYHKDGYDGSGSYYKDPTDGIIRVSLYNDNGKVDCSVICKKLGGGGHKGSGGFQVNEKQLKDLLNNKYTKL